MVEANRFWGQSTKDQVHGFKRCIFGVNLPKIKVIVLKDVFLGSIYQRSRSSFLKDIFMQVVSHDDEKSYVFFHYLNMFYYT
jgi:hypothetical protein